MKRNKMVFEIKEDNEFLYLELNGGMDIGYVKPLSKNKEEIIIEFKNRVKFYNGILISSEI